MCRVSLNVVVRSLPRMARIGGDIDIRAALGLVRLDSVKTLMRLTLLVLVTLLLGGCESNLRQPMGRPEDGPAQFDFLSSWEPAIEQRDQVNVVGYSFVLRNHGGRAGTAFCEILYKDKPLPGWSEGPEIAVDAQGRVEGEALLPDGVSPRTALADLEPECRGATGKENWTGVRKRFFAAEGDRSYLALREQGFQIRFGTGVTQSERENIRGRRTHPEVVITAVRREPGTKTLTVIDVDCIGREKDLC